MVKKIENSVVLLEAFFPAFNKELTIKEVQKEIGLSYQPIYEYLKQLTNKNILLHRRVGNIHFYSLNLKNNETVKYIELLEVKKRQSFLEKSKFRKVIEKTVSRLNEKLGSYLSSIILFGSRARKTETKKSDIDLFVLISAKEKNKIKELMQKVENICISLGYEFNYEISPVTVSVSEFKNMLKRKELFIKNLIKYSIVLYGEATYYKELIETMEELKWIE